MGQILKNGIKYTSGFFGRLRGKFVSETPPDDGYDWNIAAGPPEETQYYTGFEIQDATGVRTTHLDTHAGDDGSISAVFGAEKIVNGEPVRNQIYLRVQPDGTKTYTIDNAAAFRNALELGDSVIEKGTSGIWTYRKWSSGVAECWGITASQSYAITNTYGQGKYVNTSVNYPSGLFIDSPIVHIGKYGGGDGLIWASVNNNTTSTVTFYVADTSSHTVTCRFCIRAIGRWKS